MPLPDVGDGGREAVDVGRHLPLAGPVQGLRTATGKRLGGEHHAFRRQRLAHGGHGHGRLNWDVGLGDDEAVGDHVVEVHRVVPRLRRLTVNCGSGPAHVHGDKAPVVGGDLELVVVELRPLAPVVDGATGRGHVDPEVLVVEGLAAGVAMGVAEEMDARLAALFREILQPGHHLAGEVALSRRPQLALVRVVELGEDEVNVLQAAGRGEDSLEPGELVLAVVRAVGVEAHEADVAVVLVPPVLLVAGRAVVREVEILEIVGGVVFVVAEDRIDRHLREEVVRGVEEIVGPLAVVVAVVDEVTRDEHEGNLVGGDPAEVIEHALVDHLVEDAGVGIAPLHVAHRDKREIGFGLRQGQACGTGHFRGLTPGGDGVEIRGVREESLDEDLVHGASRGRVRRSSRWCRVHRPVPIPRCRYPVLPLPS